MIIFRRLPVILLISLPLSGHLIIVYLVSYYYSRLIWISIKSQSSDASEIRFLNFYQKISISLVASKIILLKISAFRS